MNNLTADDFNIETDETDIYLRTVKITPITLKGVYAVSYVLNHFNNWSYAKEEIIQETVRTAFNEEGYGGFRPMTKLLDKFTENLISHLRIKLSCGVRPLAKPHFRKIGPKGVYPDNSIASEYPPF